MSSLNSRIVIGSRVSLASFIAFPASGTVFLTTLGTFVSSEDIKFAIASPPTNKSNRSTSPPTIHFLRFLFFVFAGEDPPPTEESTVWIGARTVSYTHLRAHETRHDLVC